MTGKEARTRRLNLNASEQRVAFAASIADVGRKSGYVRFREWEAGEGKLTEDEARRVGAVLERMEEQSESRKTDFSRILWEPVRIWGPKGGMGR